MEREQVVSVIVPVYNVEAYLRKCLDSLCGQTYSNLEIIVVNDGTRDGSQAIIDEYARKDSRLRPLIQANGGLSAARNTGMDAATGDYIAFVDSDDWIASDMFTQMVELAEASQSDIIVCNYDKVYDDHTERQYLNLKEEAVDVREIGIAEYIYRYLFTYQHGHEVWNKLYRRSVIEQNAIRFEPNKEIFSEDLMFNLFVLCHAGRISSLNHTFYYYLQREGSIMQIPNPQMGARYVTLVERFKHYAQRAGLASEVEPVLPVLLYDLMNACITQIYKSGGSRDKIGEALRFTSAARSESFIPYMRKLAFGKAMSLYRTKTGGSRSSDLFARFFAICCMLRLWGVYSGIKYKRLAGTAVQL
ncbi:glycosyltransferase [Paenibacillus physcomitrellae]|uniref:Glycosyltransferase EpsJ n=1 Tax=Paenibacillus physcomitrellae TaxID=1619311 RepID=A0ABQ1GJJ5_9BACL|nr:glycosyltransferase [Paenibacillus physcomitrellae]GGA45064.1 putative glycosyltransferase EpsJ [Paenibacillus physcomitrellae]